MNTIVFGRFRDFEKQLSQAPPDAVLAARPVLDAQQLKATLRGIRDGVPTTPYVLMSNQTQISTDALGDKTIGTIDLLGRKKMTDFVTRLLKLNSSPRVKRVTKLQDLLPLLQFQLADAVLLSKSEADKIKQHSQLELQITDIDVKVGLPALACLTPRGAPICKQFESFDPTVNAQMGVEKWIK